MVKSLPSFLLPIAAVLLSSAALAAAQPNVDSGVENRAVIQTIVGTVVDNKGRPVPDADIVSLPNRRGMSGAVSDEQGKFRLADPDESGDDTNTSNTYSVGVSALGFAPQIYSVRSSDSTRPKENTIKLEPGHTVRGRVVDDKGAPVPFARFTLLSPSARWATPLSSNVTDDRGNFSFDSLPADAHFRVTTPIGQLLNDVHLKLDASQPVDCVIESPGEIRGRVLDAETGKPAPRFYVTPDGSRLRQPNDPQLMVSLGAKTFTPADGRFIVGPLANRMPVELVVKADGYERALIPRAVAQHPERAIELKILLLPLRPADFSAIHGRVVDSHGKGISNLCLQLIVSSVQHPELQQRGPYSGGREQGAWIEQENSGSTDSDGRFAFKTILPGRYVELTYQGAGVPKTVWCSSDTTHPRKTMSITIVPPQPGSIHGAVDRKMFPGAREVHLCAPSRGLRCELSGNKSTFEFNNLQPGSYLLYVVGTREEILPNGQKRTFCGMLLNQQVGVIPGATRELYLSK